MIKVQYLDSDREEIVTPHTTYESAMMTLQAAQAFGAIGFAVFVDGTQISSADFLSRYTQEKATKSFAGSRVSWDTK